jgi:hypothetical protein
LNCPDEVFGKSSMDGFFGMRSIGDEFRHGGNGFVGERAAGQEERDEVAGRTGLVGPPGKGPLPVMGATAYPQKISLGRRHG